MSLQDDVVAVRRCLDDLVRSVGQLERSLAQQRPQAPVPMTEGRRPDGLVTITDAPYDGSLWTDSDDEGLGVRDRHAP
ncbi:hypothetical protein [Streptomyces sp. SP18CS02]|uniref:hypothetical protein n=1 Tax=Streptomyces sp. SP18CS02 TaxID=3002531 RepID=UPI002E75F8A5|nr:hypothetical protein [Streptomyces sp. SP18CS02]MEE1756362.1 hypothetical protein [Streptomyces sp. SP18CS02]